MIIFSPGTKYKQTFFDNNDKKFNDTEEAKYLGVTLDETWKWETHLENIARKASFISSIQHHRIVSGYSVSSE